MKVSLKKRLIDFSFIAPVLLLFIIFVILPFVQGLPISLTDWDGLNTQSRFVGLKNYADIFSDPHIGNAVHNTAVFTVLTVVFSNMFGLGVALLVRKAGRANNLMRTLIFMPFCLSMLLQSYIWKYVYSDVFYEWLGLPNPLTSPTFVMVGISIICIWADTGYCMIVFIAALQGIPQDYYEAAQIEGCSRWRQFWNITLPLLGPAVTSNIIIYLGWGMKVYDYPMAATAGGPGRASETVAVLIYKNLFGYFKAGYGQAIAVLFTAAIFIITAIVAKALRRREVEL